MAELAKHYPVDVRFIEMMPIGYGKQFKTIDHNWLLENMKRSIRIWKKTQEFMDLDLRFIIKFPDLKEALV